MIFETRKSCGCDAADWVRCNASYFRGFIKTEKGADSKRQLAIFTAAIDRMDAGEVISVAGRLFRKASSDEPRAPVVASVTRAEEVKPDANA